MIDENNRIRPPLRLSCAKDEGLLQGRMMIYFYQEKAGRQRVFRKAHIAENDKPLCDLGINPAKWTRVTELPGDTHLCQKCHDLARKLVSVRLELSEHDALRLLKLVERQATKQKWSRYWRGLANQLQTSIDSYYSARHSAN